MSFFTICYNLAVACWLGGSALFTVLLTPILFAAYSRDMAGHIVGVLFPGYFRWGLVCGTVALLCRVMLRGRFALVSCLVISLMLAMVAGQAFVVTPRAADLKKEIGSFASTSPDHPLRIRFRTLHGISMAANVAVIAGGALLVLLASIPAGSGPGQRRDVPSVATVMADTEQQGRAAPARKRSAQGDEPGPDNHG